MMRFVAGVLVGFVAGALAVTMADNGIGELDVLEDECGHWSGWTDDGSPICCEQPEGHELAWGSFATPHRGQGIEWTDAEADARVAAARAGLSR